MDLTRRLVLVLCFLPLMGRAQVPEFLNQDLLAKPDRIMIFQAENLDIGDSSLFNSININIARTINQTQRFITIDHSQIHVDAHDLETYLMSVGSRDSELSRVDTLAEIYPESFLEVDHVLLFSLSEYETNLIVDKSIEKEELTNSSGEIEEIEHYKLNIEAQLGFTLKTHVISRHTGKEMESLTERIFATETYSYEVDRDEYKGNLILSILEAIIRENRLSASKQRLDKLLSQVREQAMDDLAYQLKKSLNESSTFKVATRIIYAQKEGLYFNQGDLWEVSRGDFYSVQQDHFNSTLLQVKEVQQLYSRSSMVWGQAHSNDVVLLRKMSGMAVHIGTRLMPVRVNPDYEQQVIDNLLGSVVPAPVFRQQWLHTFSWKVGLDHLMGFYTLGVVDLHFGSDLSVLSMGLSGGYKWQAGRLTLAVGAGFRYTHISSSFDVSQVIATNIGWTIDPAGSADIHITSSLDVVSFQPELEFRFHISPHFALRVQGAWHLDLGQDILNISASQIVPDPDATDDSTLSQDVYQGTLPNQYFIPGNWEVNYGLLFVF